MRIANELRRLADEIEDRGAHVAADDDVLAEMIDDFMKYGIKVFQNEAEKCVEYLELMEKSYRSGDYRRLHKASMAFEITWFDLTNYMNLKRKDVANLGDEVTKVIRAK